MCVCVRVCIYITSSYISITKRNSLYKTAIKDDDESCVSIETVYKMGKTMTNISKAKII